MMYRSWARAISAPARRCMCGAAHLSNLAPKLYTRRLPFADAKVSFGNALHMPQRVLSFSRYPAKRRKFDFLIDGLLLLRVVI